MSKIFAIPWTVAYQAPLSMEFSRQEYRSEMPFPSPGDLPEPGISCVSCINRQILHLLNHQNIYKYPKIINVFLYQWILFASWYQVQIYKELPKLSCFHSNQSDLSTLALEENPHPDSSGCWWCLAPSDLKSSSLFLRWSLARNCSQLLKVSLLVHNTSICMSAMFHWFSLCFEHLWLFLPWSFGESFTFKEHIQLHGLHLPGYP